MNSEYIKFGNGNKNMVILPEVSLNPRSENEAAAARIYDVFTKDFTVYLFKYRENENNMTLKNVADDIAQTIENLKLNDVCLYGLSMGGAVAQELVIAHPERIKKLALVSAVSKSVDAPVKEEWISYAKNKDIISLIDSFIRNVYSREYYDQALSIMISMYKNLSDEDLVDFTRRVEAMKDFDMTEELKQVKIPVLFIGAKGDKIFSYEEMKKIPDTLGCEYYFYEGYSHAVYDEAKDLKKRIYDFFMKED